MQEFKLILSVYSPVYIYTAIVLYFITLIATNMPSNLSPSINAFHRANNSPAVRLLFILTLASMLGTPPTLGFFAKLMTFYLLVQNPGIALFSSITLTLILLIFYLQTIRTGNTLKKKSTWSAQNDVKSSTGKLIFAQLFFILFTITVPYVFDVMYCFFI